MQSLEVASVVAPWLLASAGAAFTHRQVVRCRVKMERKNKSRLALGGSFLLYAAMGLKTLIPLTAVHIAVPAKFVPGSSTVGWLMVGLSTAAFTAYQVTQVRPRDHLKERPNE